MDHERNNNVATFSQLKGQFESDCYEVAAELLRAGKYEPDDCLRHARVLVVQKWARKEAHRELTKGSIRLLPKS